MFSWFWQWNKFENRSIFDEIKAYKTKVVSFLDHPVYTYYFMQSLVNIEKYKYADKTKINITICGHPGCIEEQQKLMFFQPETAQQRQTLTAALVSDDDYRQFRSCKKIKKQFVFNCLILRRYNSIYPRVFSVCAPLFEHRDSGWVNKCRENRIPEYWLILTTHL